MAVVKGKIFFKLKTKFCFYSQRNYPLPRTAIEAEILFAARVMQVRFLKRPSGKTPPEQSSSDKKIGAESAVPILVYLYIVIMVHKYRQSAKKARNKNNKSSLPEFFRLRQGLPEAEKRGLLKRDMSDARSEKKLTAGVSMIR